jgi:hypothetical protein
VSYFTAIRLFSLFELALFTALMVVAIGGYSKGATQVLGWSHGVGWILLCIAVALGCRREVFPWPLLAATVSPFGPLGSTLGLEYLSARRNRTVAGG